MDDDDDDDDGWLMIMLANLNTPPPFVSIQHREIPFPLNLVDFRIKTDPPPLEVYNLLWADCAGKYFSS